MLVIFHDPPETIGIYDPGSSKLDSHNVIVVRLVFGLPTSTDTPQTDVSVQYIEWAVKEGFSVIDVNIPKHITAIDVSPSGLAARHANCVRTAKSRVLSRELQPPTN
jgi:histone deacetylase 6